MLKVKVVDVHDDSLTDEIPPNPILNSESHPPRSLIKELGGNVIKKIDV